MTITMKRKLRFPSFAESHDLGAKQQANCQESQSAKSAFNCTPQSQLFKERLDLDLCEYCLVGQSKCL